MKTFGNAIGTVVAVLWGMCLLIGIYAAAIGFSLWAVKWVMTLLGVI